MAQQVKNSPAVQETQETRVRFLGQEDPLEEGMATHFSDLKNPMDRGAWQATVQKGAKSQTRLSTRFKTAYEEVKYFTISQRTRAGRNTLTG